MTSAEAFAAVALAAVACDGSLGRDEAHALRRQLEYRSLYRDRSEAAMGDLFDTLLHNLRELHNLEPVHAALQGTDWVYFCHVDHTAHVLQRLAASLPNLSVAADHDLKRTIDLSYSCI